MLLCFLIKCHNRSEIALLFFRYNSTIITTTIITTIADSVRTVLVTVIQASALYYDVITQMSLNCCPLLEQLRLAPCCPPCRMNLVTPLATSSWATWLQGNIAARTGGRAVDLGGPSVYQGGQNLKLSTKAAVFKKVSLLIGGPSMSIEAPLPL